MTVQLEGVVLLGTAEPLAAPADDYSALFKSFLPKISREEIVDEPDYADAQRRTVLGAEQHTVDVLFKSSHAVAGFWALAMEAIKTPTGVLFFNVQYHIGAIAAGSPAFTGQILVSTLDLGAMAGKKWEQTHTYPAQNIVMDIAP